MKQFPKKFIFLLFLAFTFAITTTSAQANKRTRKVDSASKLKQDVDKKRISEKDRNAIIGLFKGVDQRKYKLQFYNGENRSPRRVGRLKYKMNDLKRVQRITNPIDAVGWIVLIVEGDDVIYVLAVGSDKIKNVLGVAKMKRLNAIMAKYK